MHLDFPFLRTHIPALTSASREAHVRQVLGPRTSESSPGSVLTIAQGRACNREIVGHNPAQRALCQTMMTALGKRSERPVSVAPAKFSQLARKPPATCPRPAQRGLAVGSSSGPDRFSRKTPLVTGIICVAASFHRGALVSA